MNNSCSHNHAAFYRGVFNQAALHLLHRVPSVPFLRNTSGDVHDRKNLALRHVVHIKAQLLSSAFHKDHLIESFLRFSLDVGGGRQLSTYI